MSEKSFSKQRGQSIILVAVAMVALILFVAITVDMSAAYYHRRTAQNAADAAALAGSQELGRQLTNGSYNDTRVKITMNDYAERNDIPDTNGVPADFVNANVEGYYLDKTEKRLAEVGSGKVPNKALGIEALAHITAPTFFGGIFGLAGMPVQAEAAVMFESACTGGYCMLPIAIHEMGFITGTGGLTTPLFYDGECYNMWDGDGPGAFGWLNWSLQGYSCQDPNLGIVDPPSDCSSECIDINMDPDFCNRVDPTLIGIGTYVGGAPGVNNASFIRERLDSYILNGTIARIVVYDDTKGKGGCGTPANKNGYKYRVAGFGSFQITGYRLSSGGGVVECDLTEAGTLECGPGGGSALLADPASCFDYPGPCELVMGEPCEWETGDYNRITGIAWTSGGGGEGHCKAVGNLLAPVLTK